YVLPKSVPAGQALARIELVSRKHSGYAPPDNSGSGGYFSSLEIQEGVSQRPTPIASNVRFIFLVNKDTVIPPMALALQNGGTGAIVSEDPVDERQADLSRSIWLWAKHRVSVRVMELLHPDGTTGLSANRVINQNG